MVAGFDRLSRRCAATLAPRHHSLMTNDQYPTSHAALSKKLMSNASTEWVSLPTEM
jgi:hypothetical protein